MLGRMPYELRWRNEAGNGDLCFAWKVQAGSADRVALGLPTRHGLIYAVVAPSDPLAELKTSDDPMAPVKKPVLITLEANFIPALILEPLPPIWTRIGRLRAQPWDPPPPYVVLEADAAPTFWNGAQARPARVADEKALDRGFAAIEKLSFSQGLAIRPAIWFATRGVHRLTADASDQERVEIVHEFVLRLNRATESMGRTPEISAALHSMIDGLAAALGLPPARGAREPVPTRVTHWGDWARTF